MGGVVACWAYAALAPTVRRPARNRCLIMKPPWLLVGRQRRSARDVAPGTHKRPGNGKHA